MNEPTRSNVVNGFIDRAATGDRMRCGVVVGPGGYGKSVLADETVGALKAADIPVVFVAGDLALDVEFGDAQAVVVDAAEHAPGELLDRLRAEAQDPSSARSVLVFTRSVSASPSMGALCSLADREATIEHLVELDRHDLAGRLPSGTGITAEDLDELTASIPSLVDRLCHGWDELGWPSSLAEVDAVPTRLSTFVEMQLAMLDDEPKHELAHRSVTLLWAPDSEAEASEALRKAGLADRHGRVPRAVAMAVDATIDRTTHAAALQSSARTLIDTDPAQAAAMFEAAHDLPLAAAARAAAGDFAGANRLLADLPRAGAAAAAAAHVAGAEARWGDAAQLMKQATPHPYWDDAQLASVRTLYDTLAGSASGGSGETTSFLTSAADSMRGAVAASSADERADVIDELRALARQVVNQPPMLDVAISGSELASLAALTLAEFDLARSFVAGSPESSDRSALAQALDGWLATRTGADDQPTGGDDAGTVAAQTLRLAADLIDARRSSDAEATTEVVAAIVGLVSQMSVDLLTFDALCEIHVGSHRADARKPAADVAASLDRFVERADDPPPLGVRLAWSRVEAAVAGGDVAAVSAAADELASMDAAAELAPALCAAADQWSAIMQGSVNEAPVLEAIELLEEGGYVWEAAALAGQAAIRSDDAGLAKALLARGREFRSEAPEQKITSPAGLSDREIEIGLLVLAGHSYKEIGATCYISPKTVEHHVAHIRQKLTAVGVPRSEFRAKLQADLQPDS